MTPSMAADGLFRILMNLVTGVDDARPLDAS